MSAIIVNGAEIGKRIRAEVAAEVAELAAKGVTPGLAVILVGEDRASATYVRSKQKACGKAGILSELQHLPDTTGQDELVRRISELNARDEIDGILVQKPLPAGIDYQAVVNTMDPAKDVDGFHPISVGRLVIGLETFVPATPLGVMEILREHEVPLKGARAVVVGRSDIVGKPLAILLMHNHATVTICHSRTRDLAGVCREADILVAATGRTGMITPEFVKAGAAVIDVGINAVDDPAKVRELFGDDPRRQGDLQTKGYTIAGDVHPAVAEKAGLFTPVPGGVGKLTIAMLLKNCVQAARMRRDG
ncbi:MAG TPA: bifunctional 5,10-methylenetetrahydrofolate dehydrogenase/5,10-methenyltetrahydrofolate cyclohydrolase [Acidobacteriota bacterium]|nr:bifunctional 5,10-methylenetetrahydrofolate dehydrogenase/5,10-methenyltetrahydrofolate cyclohydrolase [Acidobacteriota bacterium]